MSRWFPFTRFPFRGDVLYNFQVPVVREYQQRQKSIFHLFPRSRELSGLMGADKVVQASPVVGYNNFMGGPININLGP